MKLAEAKQEATNSEVSTVFDITVDKIYNDTNVKSEEEIDKKMIPYIEKEIRNSFEYRNYIQYLKDEMDLKSCSLIPNLSLNDVKFSLEFHHYPLNLYEITEIILKSELNKVDGTDYGVSLFKVAEKVVEEHYKNNIGLVPLSETVHEMAHNRSVFIPKDSIYGNYEEFISKYDQFVNDDIKDRISALKVRNEDEVKSHNKNKLKKEISKYDIKYN